MQGPGSMCKAEPRVSVHPDLVSEVDRAQGRCVGGTSPHQARIRVARRCPPGSLWRQFLPVTRVHAGMRKQD